MSDALFAFIATDTGIVGFVSRFDDPHDGFDVLALPDGVWIGWTRLTDGTFAAPTFGHDDLVPDVAVPVEVPA